MRFTVFGDDIEKSLQKEINSDPMLKSYQEVNDMQDLGYTYKDIQGHEYENDGIGGWTMDGEPVEQEFVRKQIQEDIFTEEMGTRIILNNLSTNGKIVDLNKYRNEVAASALYCINDVYGSDIDLVEMCNRLFGKQFKYKDAREIDDMLGSMKGIGAKVSSDYLDLITDEERKKVEEYYKLRYGLSKYLDNFIQSDTKDNRVGAYRNYKPIQ